MSKCEEVLSVVSGDPYVSANIQCQLESGHEGHHNAILRTTTNRKGEVAHCVDREEGSLDSENPSDTVFVQWRRP